MTLVKLWGTRGSLPTPGSSTMRYGGNTSCVQVGGDEGPAIVLDAGTGIRELGISLTKTPRPVHVLLTHLHLDHILGLGFFIPLFSPGYEVHIWGPASTTVSLENRLMRYLSPPLFPLHLLEMSMNLHIHEIACDTFQIGGFSIRSALVCHPGPTVGYRITGPNGKIVAYIPDHEPALGVQNYPLSPDWTSGVEVAEGADLLIHDSQYSGHEYEDKQGWGHSSLEQALIFGGLAEVREFVSFHYDPSHNDSAIDQLVKDAAERVGPRFTVTPGVEGQTFEV